MTFIEATRGFLLVKAVAPDQTAVKPGLCRFHTGGDCALVITEIEVLVHMSLFKNTTLIILISLRTGID